MSASSLSPPPSPAVSSRLQQPPTPQATTAAILGASSNGWSPLRLHKNKNEPAFQSPSQTGENDNDDAAHPSSQSPKKQTQNFASLRSHGLVSNSIFLQQAASSNSLHDSAASPAHAARHSGSPHVPSPSTGGARTSVGLGIGVSSSPSRIPISRRSGPSPRKASRDQTPAPAPDSENQTPSDVFGPLTAAPPTRERPTSPRKSKGFEVLQRSSYVSNSPFKQIENRGHESGQSPVALPSPRKLASPAHGRTETSVAELGQAGPDAPSTPTSKGLLVSNRLHGPRTMEASLPKPSNDGKLPRQRQRRKTVTFDEILDVQEFDKESSFDVESMRSDVSIDNYGHDGEGDEDPMWLSGSSRDEDSLIDFEDDLRNRTGGRLQIVNGSPDPSTPDMLHDSFADDLEPELSCDSRETSSIDDEPASPPARSLPSPHRRPADGADASFDKTFATAGTNLSVDESIDERDFNGSFSGLCAADRVDSLVDELLNEDILHSPSQRTASPVEPLASSPLPAEPTSQLRNESVSDAEARGALRVQQVELPAVKSMQATLHDASSPIDAESLSDEVASQQMSTGPRDGHRNLVLPASESRELPELPAWSPLTFNDGALGGFSPMQTPSTPQTAEQPLEPEPSASPSKKNGSLRGRPHISRDAILQRVAREKQQRLEQEQMARQQPMQGSPAPQPVAAAMRAPRGSEPGIRPQRSFEASFDETGGRQAAVHPRPSAPIGKEDAELAKKQGISKAPEPAPIVATEARPQPPPSPVKAMRDVESPLEKLGAAYMTAADADSAVEEARGRCGSDAAMDTEDRLLPPRPSDAEIELRGPSNGRLSPSMLGAPPPPITPAQQAEQIILRRRSKNGKGRRKRSMSTGDAGPVFTAARSPLVSPEQLEEEELSEESSVGSEPAELPNRQSISADLARSKAMLDVSLQRAIDSGFSANLESEISRIYRQGELTYKINDRGTFQGIDDKVSHTTAAGDVDSGKAWRKLRRPSDMNEYAREMREYRQNENPKRASGKVFVMVDSFTPAALPIPSKPTYFHCVLDNGLHMVQTATVPLRPGAPSKIAQEFELIQHKNLEFSLTLVVKRDAHLQEPQRPASPGGMGRKEHTSPTLKAFSRLFTSPKKQAAKRLQQERDEAAELAAQASRAEPMLSYINREGAFGRAGVVFDKVAASCHGKCLVLELPVYGASNPVQSMSGPSSLAGRGDTIASPFAADFSRNLNKVRGTLRLKLFYLPAMPTIPRDKLPENLGECIRGMQNAVWHRSAPWREGTLTQMGGDCLSWRRRPVKAQGQFLVCYNEVTKKPTVKIDLSKAVAVEVAADSKSNPPSRILGASDGRASRSTVRSVNVEEDPDANYEVERSFRITFADGERIHFFADTDEEKERWVEVLSNVIESPIPPNPLWAQVALESISQSAQLSSNIPKLAGAQPRKSSSKHLRDARKPPPVVAEEPVEAKAAGPSPSSEAARSAQPPVGSLSGAANGSTRSTPSKLPMPQQPPSLASMRSTPSRLPLPSEASQPQPQAQPQPPSLTRPGPPVPQKGPALSVPRPVVHNPAGNVAFDRLRRAAANRSEASSHGSNTH
ncbi:uncharacterized protein PFL1_05730 [Pseudozyma flocculosa PF-1]|uniref:PH domain-containing protein n=2 Tax=Pseudozyma flocculosa TaxID=84751 RepID=A0A5C3F8Y7_9BASI|nr:uncharacterized protein PFL1_05730 [Pseudozyma flocculosa PF-1]EPQ26751.1 hypothetical protein PFL1_05730 [Pseudozyma flocculosa PF-1]SPO40924.1 uncharacterized protein PSFLO_06406 [Pseudozyma flocculosa]